MQVDEDFLDFVRARQDHLLRAAVLVCGNHHLAQDLLQDALAKLASRWSQVREGTPEAYVRTILYRDAISHWRKWRREKPYDVHSPDGDFVTRAQRITDLGIQLRWTDGSQEVEPLVRALLEDVDPSTMGPVAVEVTEPIGDTLTGELQVWGGAYEGTGEQVTFTITDNTRCLVTRPGGELGVDLELGSCADLMVDLEESPIAQAIVTPDGEVLTARAPSTF